MRTPTRLPIRNLLAVVITATFAAVSSVAESQMYRWTDVNGSINYSDEPPAERTGIRDLTLIEVPGSRAVTPDVRARPNPEVDKLGSPEAQPKTATSVLPRSVPLPPLPAAADAFTADAPAASAAPRLSGGPTPGPEAVRDPCLRSSDPKCHQRNRNAYVPHRGYSPTALQAAREAEGMGMGSTSGAAGGTLGGGAGARPVRLTAPKASTYALPPGNVLPLNPSKP